MNNRQTPIARRTGLVVRKIKNEGLVYDIEVHEAHCLNLNVATIWDQCDGTRTIKDLSDLLSPDENISEHQRDQMVWIALDELGKANLLDKPVPKPEMVIGMSRRQLMKTAGI